MAQKNVVVQGDVAPPFLRTQFNYDTNAASDACGLFCPDTPEDRRTKQEFADEVDINTIIDKFMRTGEMPKNLRMPEYADYSEVMDFQTAMNAVIVAEEEFLKIPPKVRARFGNDPNEFLNFVMDEKNRDEMVNMGLIARPPPVSDPGALSRAGESVTPSSSPSASPVPAAGAGGSADTGKGG